MNMTRREMMAMGLGTLAAGPLLASIRTWPRTSENEPWIFTKMNLIKRTIQIGLPKPFRIVHVSDTHLTYVSAEDFEKLNDKSIAWYCERSRCFEGGVPGLAAALAYAKVNGLPLFHTGDLFDFASRGNFDALRRDFAGRDWFFACGNHEYEGWGPGWRALSFGKTEAERKKGRELYESCVPNGITCSSRVIGGVNFVQYDNGGLSDCIGLEQFALVRKEFEKGLPVVLLCHMPFFTDAIADFIVRTHNGMTRDRLYDGYLQGTPWAKSEPGRKEMLAWLKGQPLLKAIICGHLHREFVDDFTPTVRQYVAAANYDGAVYEYTFA